MAASDLALVPEGNRIARLQMSALPPEAVISSGGVHVRLVPEADISVVAGFARPCLILVQGKKHLLDLGSPGGRVVACRGPTMLA